MIKILAPIVLISLILLAFVGINYKNKPAEKPIVKPTEQSKTEEPTTKADLEETDSQLTIPKSVSLSLESLVEANQRLPVIVIKAFAGPNGCYETSGLKIKQEVSSDRLTVNILGHKVVHNIDDVGQLCAAVVVESKAEIKLDMNWLQENNKEITFILNGQENTYKLDYKKYKFSLNPVKTINVIIDETATPEIILYPTDIAVLYIAGNVDLKKDYRQSLIPFAKTKGFILAETVYTDLPFINDAPLVQVLLVIVKNQSLPEANRADLIGELPGEPGVSVHLKRLQDR